MALDSSIRIGRQVQFKCTWYLSFFIATLLPVFRMEDLTDPEEIRKNPKCDRNVSLYGYVRGTHLKKQTACHIPGMINPTYHKHFEVWNISCLQVLVICFSKRFHFYRTLVLCPAKRKKDPWLMLRKSFTPRFLELGELFMIKTPYT